MAGSTSNLKVLGPVQNIGGGGGLNIIGKYPDDIDKAKPGDALIDEYGNIWINDGTTWVQVEAVKGEDGKDGEDGVDGKDGVGVPEGGQDGQILVKVGPEDFETKWDDVEFSSDAGNLVELNPVRKALRKRKPKEGEEVVLPLGKVVMYVGLGTPSDWPEIENAKTGSLFTSTTGDGFFFRDNDGWGIVGGSDDAPELPDDLVTQEDLEGLATEEYVDDANADTLAYVDKGDEETLTQANAYTDEKIAEGVEGEINLDGYATSVEVSEGDAKTLEDAKAYTDTAVGNIDIPDSYTKDEANEIANDLTENLHEYVKNEDAGVLEDSKEYTDEQIAAIDFPDGGGSFFGENPPTEDLKEGNLFIDSDNYRQYVYDGSVWIEISPASVDDSDVDEILKTLNPFVDVEPASITGELSRIYRSSNTNANYLYSGIHYNSNAIGYSQYRFDVDVLGDDNWLDYNDLPSDIKSELVLSKGSSGNNISFTVKVADHGGDINDPSTYPQPGYENLLIRYWAKNVVNDREELVVSEGVSPWVVNHVQYPDVYPDAGGAE